MPVRPLSDGQEVIGPYVSSVVDIVRSAHALYVGTCAPVLYLLEGRTKASFVRDLIVGGLKRWADNTDGVHFFRNGNLCWVGFRNNWIIRVKMIDDDFQVGVSPTESSARYNCNETPKSMLDLIGEVEATFLYLGWRATENAPLDPDIALVCNNSVGEPHWVWPLSGDGPPPALELPVPDAPSGNDDGDDRVRIRPRTPAKEA